MEPEEVTKLQPQIGDVLLIQLDRDATETIRSASYASGP